MFDNLSGRLKINAIVSESCLIIGIIDTLIGVYLIFNYMYVFGEIIPLVLSLGSIPVSLGIALFAVGLTFGSQVRNDINSNDGFLKVLNDFEDKRIEVFQKNSQGDFRQMIRDCWKLRRFSERAISVSKLFNIEQKNITLFYQQLDQLFYWTAMPFHGVFIQDPDNGDNTIFVQPMRKEEIDNILIVYTNFRIFRFDDIQRIMLEFFIENLEYIRDHYYQ